MTIYLALVRKDADSDYGVDFPDFPGCVTTGRTLEEAKSMATEALELHVGGMLEDREAIPEPTTLDILTANPGKDLAVVMLIEVHTQPSKAVRINVTLPEELVQRIDSVASNRSRFLAEAARAKLIAA